MTTPELYRTLADETERREAAERRVKDLQRELEELRSTMSIAPEKNLLSVSEAAKHLRRSPSFLHKDRLYKHNKIPFIQECSGGRVLYNRVDLDKYLESKLRGKKKAA